MKRWRVLALALLAGAAVLVGSFATAQEDVAIAGDTLALPAAGRTNGCSISDCAPEVIFSLPKTISSETRPPMQMASREVICS